MNTVSYVKVFTEESVFKSYVEQTISTNFYFDTIKLVERERGM